MPWRSWLAVAAAAVIPPVTNRPRRRDRPGMGAATVRTAVAVGFGLVGIAA